VRIEQFCSLAPLIIAKKYYTDYWLFVVFLLNFGADCRFAAQRANVLRSFTFYALKKMGFCVQ
jgi:hypothetical protein